MSESQKQLILLPNLSKQINGAFLLELLLCIDRHGWRIRCGTECRALLADSPIPLDFYEERELFTAGDLILVLGGDGSIIEAVRRSHFSAIPIAGINLGRVGYLAELECGEWELLACLLRGEGEIESRILLDVTILRGEETVHASAPALNEVVLTNGPVPRLLSFELHCGGEMAQQCYADGMILSTPTGSTAYSLSAGGPVVDPAMDCICATPICPQAMNFHPVIFRGDSVLQWRNMITRSPESRVYLSVDSRDTYELQAGDVVSVTHSTARIYLMRVRRGGFLCALRRKFT